jgi:hypothetical protein
VKSDGDIQWVGVEAGFLIAKAAVSKQPNPGSCYCLFLFFF